VPDQATGITSRPSGITAAAHIVAEADNGGVTRFPVLSSQVPLVLRRTPDAVYLVGGAAGPLGGDVLSLLIEVGPGAFVRVRTAAASVVLPSQDGAESVLRMTATVGAGARLEYLPEPVVLADGARHRVDLRVDLAEGAALLLRDELILGRHGEQGGSCVTRLRADVTGTPLLRHELTVSGTDQIHMGPAIMAGHRAVGSVLQVEPGWAVRGADRPRARYTPGVAVMPLARSGSPGVPSSHRVPSVLISALAPDALRLRQRLERAMAEIDTCD
jgi:urease accessory protein